MQHAVGRAWGQGGRDPTELAGPTKEVSLAQHAQLTLQISPSHTTRPTPSLKVDARNVAGPNQLEILKAHDSLSAGKARPPQDFQVSVVNPRSEGAWQAA
jgi:hypothetical protein